MAHELARRTPGIGNGVAGVQAMIALVPECSS